MSKTALHEIFYFDSIAVVGASKDTTKRGFRSIQKLLEDGFAGTIYPVNPKEDEILGLPCFKSVEDIPGDFDLALVCTPAKTLPGVIEQCGRKNAKGAVVLAGGFAEAGAEGAALQQAMVQAARRHGVRIIGPNTSGIFNTHNQCNVVGFSQLRKGAIGLLSQSGNMALSLVTEAQANGEVGLSTYVGIGNESDIRFDEYLDYFADDENTSVVIAYVEGMKDGPAFLKALRDITRKKPVVLYKSGRTGAGISSAKSHTGALAGDYAVSQGVLRQAGAVLATKSDEILSLAEALSLLPPLKSRRIAVLADGGGHATIAADALTERGLELGTLSPPTQRRLSAILPPSAAIANPIDVAGGTDANPALFAECARILLEDDHVDGLLITGLYGGYGVRFSQSLTPVEMATSAEIAAMSARFGKPIVIHSLYASLYSDLRPAPLTCVREAGIPVYDSLEMAVRCIEAVAQFGEAQRRPCPDFGQTMPRSPGFARVIARCREEMRVVVLEHEARQALVEAGVPASAPAILARTPQEALGAFRELGAVPVAMKVVSKDIIHKSDAGGVKLNLAAQEEIADAYAEILGNCRKAVQDPHITGMLVTPMAPKGGVEVIIGVVRDPTYGPVMMFGLGGVLVEVLKDVTFRSLPLTREDASQMLEDIRCKAILDGVRGSPPVDKAALVQLMMSISALCTSFPEIEELDLNPVMAYATGLRILDARIVLSTQAEPSAQPSARTI
ncbi:acetate--CoA ligase family protein [Burkholderia ambifaria]|uniref:CoA-binding domain protein n=1 Tax=Burkholderia ambifaria MEX-5 TaxID=396597 RepID=B1T453_9BURK|nr:acetate--CoA ligase [Burkholderia ambifaria]EDT41656.1 CoA-binding domain protein [Burkholderia ambifaria MEX-5]